jgi:hypothetical protein
LQDLFAACLELGVGGPRAERNSNGHGARYFDNK